MKKSELKNLIKEVITESAVKDLVFVEGDQLWFSYLPGSGYTHQLKDFRKTASDHPKAKSDEYVLKQFIEWASVNQPIKKKNTQTGYMKLFKIPKYPWAREFKFSDVYGRSSIARFDIFANKINADSSRPELHIDDDLIIHPKEYIYIILTKEGGYHWLYFFKSKNEALGWFNSTMGDKD